MELFESTLGRMIYLFAFILAGYLLARLRIVKPDSAGVLSKLENTLFIPALVMGTLMESFTMDKINQAWKLLLFSLAI
ncbi:MAG: AEC family transporter, partial [Clostridia bacterium]|nr:AEC family transporter [Clostridia bacterium]